MALIDISVTITLDVPDDDLIQWESDQVVACLHRHVSSLIAGNELVSKDTSSEPAIISQIVTEWPGDVAGRAIRRFHSGLQAMQERTGMKFETLMTAVIAERKG